MTDIENGGGTHGYVWSDGTTRATPEPKNVQFLGGGAFIANLPLSQRISDAHKTNADIAARAYAAWVKSFGEWQKEFEAWKVKHGQR